MDLIRRIRASVFASILCCTMLLPADTPQAALFSEFVDPHPAPGNQFGAQVVALSTGNVVITSPYDDAGGTDAGAVYLFNGATGALISTLRGSTPFDYVGIGGDPGNPPTLNGVTVLSNGNYVIRSPFWNNGAAVDAGAATWGSGTTGVSGVVSAANSLVGSTGDDRVAHYGVVPLTNGNYVVSNPVWDNGAIGNAGAATWGNGSTGVSGVVSAANSLVGSRGGDQVGRGVRALTNGNYVVPSGSWDNGTVVDTGAATWGNGNTGVSGVISAANSLIGSTAGDQVGSPGVAPLSNGNYVVCSRLWDNGAVVNVGAATWCNGATGMIGVVSAANSLIGSTASDRVGDFGAEVLTNGNYVVRSADWINPDTGASAGAATWGNGTTGVTGVVSIANSLVGSMAGDAVGNNGVVALPNGNYVVLSPFWNSFRGAATWGSGTSGVSGVVSAANSVVGSTPGLQIGQGDNIGQGAHVLSNGNYVLTSIWWSNGAAVNSGAATWCSGTTGLSGVVSAANSLVGSQSDDRVSSAGVTALSNGNYAVVSWEWDNGAVADAGAATWCSGTTGLSGEISAANSLIGSKAGDLLGIGGVTALSNGNYVVASFDWDDGAVVNAGAATWGNGATGTTGVVSAANSLVGSQSDDRVSSGGVTALSNGNYAVVSWEWDNGAVADAGAATWGSGTTGVIGVVSAANTLVGSTAGDVIGANLPVTALSNGNYVVGSPSWDNGAVTNASAATWGNGATGISGVVSAANSLVGATAGPAIGNLKAIVVDEVNHTFIAPFTGEGGGRVRVGSQGPTVSVGDGLTPARLTIGVRPNPTIGSQLHVAFALPTGEPARLELLDVSGRRVLAREVGSLGSGQHSVNLAEGRKVTPGIYWVRLTQGANRQRTRAVVIE